MSYKSKMKGRAALDAQRQATKDLYVVKLSKADVRLYQSRAIGRLSVAQGEVNRENNC